jgi:alpha-L-fucosidase
MKKSIITLAAILLLIQGAFAQKVLTKDEQMQWWREARFGMFIHWGVYSLPA